MPRAAGSFQTEDQKQTKIMESISEFTKTTAKYVKQEFGP